MVRAVAFCAQCKSLAYPKDGRLVCRKCGWTGDLGGSRVVTTKAESREQVVIERKDDIRPQQETECPKCGHHKAYFHLMQTRKSDEPPTQINECVKCQHSWRKY